MFKIVSHLTTKLKEKYADLEPCRELRVGYMDPGHGWKGKQRWITCDEDLKDMYKVYSSKAFQSFIYASSFDIIAITETWLSDHFHSNEILPNNFNLIRKDRGTRGGGVLLAINSSIPFKQLSTPVNEEILSVEIKLNNRMRAIILYV